MADDLPELGYRLLFWRGRSVAHTVSPVNFEKFSPGAKIQNLRAFIANHSACLMLVLYDQPLSAKKAFAAQP